MSADPYIWIMAGTSEKAWKEIKHCYESCCHAGLTVRTGAKVPCGRHCEVDDDWTFYNVRYK
jgi:hypothetical protein